MIKATLARLLDIIQEDVGNRGLRTDPNENLITACQGDFASACRSVAETQHPHVAVVTGFFIPHGQPPCGETDGPLGAVFLARALLPLGAKVSLVTDSFCVHALEVGLAVAGLSGRVDVIALPSPDYHADRPPAPAWQRFRQKLGAVTQLIALERVGPSHTAASIDRQRGASPAVREHFLREVPSSHHDRCHTMKARDITTEMSPAHLLFERALNEGAEYVTIGIGDGGNEMGMGKVPWEVIRRNVPGGGLVACRVPTDFLIVCGVSNWGAYGLAMGVSLLRGRPLDQKLFDPEAERAILQAMVERGPLVDGVTGLQTVSVDGLTFERYIEPLRRLANVGR